MKRVAEEAATRFAIAAVAADGVLTNDLRSDPTQFPEYLCTAMRRSDDGRIINNQRARI